jgi:hypothetical protein
MILAMIVAASTVAVVAIAAVVRPYRADLHLAPRRPTAPVGTAVAASPSPPNPTGTRMPQEGRVEACVEPPREARTFGLGIAIAAGLVAAAAMLRAAPVAARPGRSASAS